MRQGTIHSRLQALETGTAAGLHIEVAKPRRGETETQAIERQQAEAHETHGHGTAVVVLMAEDAMA